MSLLHHIRRQPLRTRQTMFALCVVITVALVGTAWFQNIQRQTFALVNPDPEVQAKYFAQLDAAGADAPLARVSQAFVSMRASLYDLFRGQGTSQTTASDTPVPLPVSSSVNH